MPAAEARKLFDRFGALLEAELPGRIQLGAFGKDMKVSAIDNEPYVLILNY
ncbi:D-Tyr-tRNA(Tyr) deacylase [Brevinema andersonii]|uniref:D-Tyr-tRNA(Tyr) deacylase n=2 Tax=Brevinema andersonii TaxID=34097 RepID=A0A1I1D2V7_BREAD|nr:D-Tyr-tRNA(Tyr) deacylase [Brevinema andersonii]